jgi:hypothetical protein
MNNEIALYLKKGLHTRQKDWPGSVNREFFMEQVEKKNASSRGALLF